MGESADAGEEPERPPEGVEPQTVLASLLSHQWGRRSGRVTADAKLPEVGIPIDSFGHDEIRREYEETFHLDRTSGFWVLPHDDSSS